MANISKRPSVKPIRGPARWSIALTLGVVAAASTLVLWSAPVDRKSVTLRIRIENMEFYPSTLEVRVGDRIEFKNLDLVPHTATSTTRQTFDSGTLKSGESWNLTCREEGVTGYRCIFHPAMTGSIKILPR